MKLNHIVIVFMIVCGAVAGGIQIVAPQAAQFMLPPFFWLLMAMLVFEGITHWRLGGAPGSLISMEFRLIALFAGVAMMLAITYIAGVPVRLL